MKRSASLDRRRFLQVAATSAASGAAVSCSRAGKQWRFFTDAEAATVGAVCDQIIPPDEDPGAADAGVVNFIDRQLVGHYSYLQEDYQQGIAGIDEASAEKFGGGFVEISAEQQLELLKELEDSAFFRMIREHTMQGFYGDPRHGGNRDAVSWRMLGVPNPPVRGRHQYEFTKSTLAAPGSEGAG